MTWYYVARISAVLILFYHHTVNMLNAFDWSHHQHHRPYTNANPKPNYRIDSYTGV